MSNERGRNKAEDVAVAERPALQWANGRVEYKGSRGRFESLVGWHVQVGKSEAFDAFAQAAGFPQITIRHPRKGEAPALVTHWSLGDTVRLYPLTYGPLATTMRGAVRVADRMASEAGIVAVWGDGPSYLSLLVVLEVNGEMCHEPLILLEKSTMTDHLYTALMVHLQICEAADAVAGCQVPCVWIALPLGAGREYDAGTEQTTTVTMMEAQYPDGAEQIDAEYLKRISLSRDLRRWAQDLCGQSIRWAQDVLARQRSGGAAPAGGA